MIEELLFKVGVPTFKTNLITQLTTSKSINLGQQAPTNIGWIFGLSLNISTSSCTTDFQGNTLVTATEAANLWLNLKIGSSVFMENVRLTEFIYQEGNTVRGQDRNYMPVSVPLDLDWKQSTIANPTGISSGNYVNFDLYYIDKQSYQNLLGAKVLWVTGNNPNT